jgi:DNA (cytosine-5)-methyltransferase 1
MLTCADLFCGAGGFSEGFRQAGFRVTKALDIWAPAVLTHEKNHPDTEAIRGDIFSYAPERIGPVDVLIGSPPCTEFSFANRGGGGDIEEGLRLVYRFLRFVYELGPRWWVMENVPRVLDFLPEEVPLRKLGIDKRGSLPIPVRAVLTSADYGAPQLRKRAFSGDFPIPAATHGEAPSATVERWRTLRDVVAALPDPLRPVWKIAPRSGDPATRSGRSTYSRESDGHTALDPVYEFELPLEELTDHFSRDLLLSEEEVRENRKAKVDHSWYGRMSFPDELDRPARTVMATNLRVARETTVIGAGRGRYRRLSVREAASVQGFPITYQWWGNTTSLKFKLVGNAVVPPVAFAIAREIVRAAARPVPERPHVVTHVTESAPLPSERERTRALPLTRRFREHVPGSKVPGFRVDLDNQGASANGHITGWRAVLYRGGGKALRQREVSLDEALRLLALTVADARTRARAKTFLTAVDRALARIVPDASTLQRIRAERERGEVTPYVIIERIAELVGRHETHGTRVVRLDARRDPDFVPPRIAATLVATAYACALANEHPARPRLALPSNRAAKRAAPSEASPEARASRADRPT